MHGRQETQLLTRHAPAIIIIISAQRHKAQGRAVWERMQTLGACLPAQVITFTNHALNSFLLGLVAAGVENLVRVGSKQKSPELERLNLIEKARGVKSAENRRLEWELRRQAQPAAGAVTADLLQSRVPCVGQSVQCRHRLVCRHAQQWAMCSELAAAEQRMKVATAVLTSNQLRPFRELQTIIEVCTACSPGLGSWRQGADAGLPEAIVPELRSCLPGALRSYASCLSLACVSISQKPLTDQVHADGGPRGACCAGLAAGHERLHSRPGLDACGAG